MFQDSGPPLDTVMFLDRHYAILANIAPVDVAHPTV